MKQLLTLSLASVFFVACNQNSSTAAKEDSNYKDSIALVKEIEKEAQPAYIDAYKKVYRVKNNVALVEKGLLNKNEVVVEFNQLLGPEMGRLRTIEQIKERLDTAGEAYIQYKFEKAKAEIALTKAAEASSNH